MPEGKHGTALFQLEMVNAIPQEAEIQLRVLWGARDPWLTLGTAALVFGHFMGDLLSQQKRNPAAVVQNLHMYFHTLIHTMGGAKVV